MRNRTHLLYMICAAILASALAACTEDDGMSLCGTDTEALTFSVGSYPAFGGDRQTRSAGIYDEGKTSWQKGDQILLRVTTAGYKVVGGITLTCDGYGGWHPDQSVTLPESPKFIVIYSPDQTFDENSSITMKDGAARGLAENLQGTATVNETTRTVSIDFSDVTWRYSRLRIVCEKNTELTVDMPDFDPWSSNYTWQQNGGENPVTLSTDDNGNAFLYGSWAAGVTLTVKCASAATDDNPEGILWSKELTTASEAGRSHVVDATPSAGLSE